MLGAWSARLVAMLSMALPSSVHSCMWSCSGMCEKLCMAAQGQ